VPRSDAPRAAAAQKYPEADIESIVAALESRLSKLGRPSKKKGGGAKAPKKDDVVKVYDSEKQFAADEADERAVYGEEYDDTPRGLLKLAAKLPPDSRTVADRIRQVSETRLAGKTIEAIERGGKAILVGDRVALRRAGGVEQVFMRAREEKTGALFWALQSSRAARPPESGAKGRGSPVYPAPPSDEDAATFARDSVAAALARLKSVPKKFAPDDVLVTRAINSMVDHGHYTAPDFVPLTKRVEYAGTVRPDTHETDEFRPVSLTAPPEDASEGVSGYLEVAAAALLGTLFPRGIRLPKKIDGSAWLVKIAVADEDPRYSELLEAGGGTDPLRLKFLVETSLNAAAVAVLLTDLEPAEASALLAGADVEPFLESSKAKDVWAAAVKKKLSPDAVSDAAQALRLRSPLLDHIVDVVQSAEDNRVDEAASLPLSRLKDWSGFKPSLEAMSSPDKTSVKAEDATARAVEQNEDTVDDAEALARLKAALKKAGAPQDARAAFDVFASRPGSDGVAALKNGAFAVWSVLGMISASAKNDSVARFRNVTPADAKMILKEAAGAKAALTAASGATEATRAWVDLVGALPDEFVLLASENAAARLKVAHTDVDALLARMEAAKEAIKNEKIQFVQSVDESAQSAMAALRSIGLQTIDDQILAFDRAASSSATQPRDDGDSYDTMDFYDEDDGIDYDD